jgi:hypothetical protein
LALTDDTLTDDELVVVTRLWLWLESGFEGEATAAAAAIVGPAGALLAGPIDDRDPDPDPDSDDEGVA